MDRIQSNQIVQFVLSLDIASNPEPAAIFDPLIQGFNLWAITSDHPGGDWDLIVDKFDAGSYTKRCKYVGCAFWYADANVITLTTDAYALRDHLTRKYGYKGQSIHNRKDDVAWCIQKIKWVFEQVGIECPPILVGEDT